MNKQVIKFTGAFVPGSKTIDFSSISGFTQESLVSVINLERRAILYCPAMETGFGGTWSGNVLTLDASTTGHDSADKLQIQTSQQVYITDNAYLVKLITDVSGLVKDSFVTQDTSIWDFTGKDANDLILSMGNVAGCSWMSIVKSALVADTKTEIVTKSSWAPAVLGALAASLSNRVFGQEFSIELVGVDGSGAPVLEADSTAIALSAAGAVVVGTALTFTTQSAHPYRAGDILVHYGNVDARINYGPIVVQSTPTPTSYTVTTALGVATYATGSAAFVRRFSPAGRALYVLGHRFVGNTAGNNDIVARNGQARSYVSNWNVQNTNEVASAASDNGVAYSNVAYVQALKAKSEYGIRFDARRALFGLRDLESNGSPRAAKLAHQFIPDISRSYKLRVRAVNLPNKVVPIYPVTAAAHAAANTTVTLTIGVGHPLTTSDRVCYVGCRDQVNFANQTSSLAISAVNSGAGTITVAFGSSAISSSYGGFIYRTLGGDVGVETLASSSIQSYLRVADAARGDRLQLTFAASPGGSFQVGEVATLWGLVTATPTVMTGLHGRYRIELWNTTTFQVELTPLDGQDISGVSTSLTNAGGTLIKNTEFRLHNMRIEHNEPVRTEVVAGAGDSGQADAVPVQVPAGVAINGTVTLAGAAHSSAASGSIVRATGKVATTVDTTLVAGDAADLPMTSSGQAVVKLNATPELEFTVVSPASGSITASTIPITVQSAPVASTRNYYNGIHLCSDVLGAATELVLRDTVITSTAAALATNTLVSTTAHGQAIGDAIVFNVVTGLTGVVAGTTYYVLTVPSTTSITLSATMGGATLTVTGTPSGVTWNHILWRMKLQTSGLPVPQVLAFSAPLRGGVAMAQELVTLTSATGAVYFGAQGYRGF